MVGARMSRKARRHFKKIQRAESKYTLQEIASAIQTDLDKRHLSHDEALMLGNMIQNRADQVPATPSSTPFPTVTPIAARWNCIFEMPCSPEQNNFSCGKSVADSAFPMPNTRPCSINCSLNGNDRANPSPLTDSRSQRKEVRNLSKPTVPLALVALMLVASLTPLAVADSGRSTPTSS